MQLIRQHFTLIDSTNTWARQHAHLLAQDAMTLVTADEQTCGRGRFKREWISPPKKNIYASFCFFLDKRDLNLGNIPQVLALSTLKMLEPLGFQAHLKWPNDVLIGEKKIAGILAETTMVEDKLCMIIGIGLNVNMPLDLLKRIDRPATSLLAEQSRPFDIEQILDSLTNTFLQDYHLFITQGFSPFLTQYRQSMIQDCRVVSFHDNVHLYQGTYKTIHDDGSLAFLLSDGTEKTFIAGEFLG